MDRCKTIEDVIKRIEYDGIEYVRFEASNINGQSLGKTVPVRHIKTTFKNGLPVFCGSWFFTVSYGNAGDTIAEGLTYRNSYNYPYPDTYTVIPYYKNTKVAKIMMYPFINNLTKEIWPIDPRSICLQQLRELKAFGYDLYSSFEHEFQMIDNNTSEPLWDGKEFASNNKFAENQDFAFELDKYLYAMGIDIEVMHVEYAPGQYELPMKPSWNIYSSDNSFTFRNAIKQIAKQKNYLATFATTPFPDKMNGASNGTHFNFSIWKDNVVENDKEQPVDNVTDEKKEYENNDINNNNKGGEKINVFYDKNSDNKLSEIAMYFIGGILEHTEAMTVFANITPNCYRRTIAAGWAPGNVSWGRNNRTVLLRLKTDGQNGTYMEYRLPGSACNPYMVATSVIAAGIDGIKNKIKPKYKEFVKAADDKEYENIPKLPQDMKTAIAALKKDKIIWNAFGDRFCTMFINAKELEIKELEVLAKEIGKEAAETKIYLNI